MERPIELVSNNLHNYRHGKENPVIVGVVHYTPSGLDERMCIKVQYTSDNSYDYIPVSSLGSGDWKIL